MLSPIQAVQTRTAKKQWVKDLQLCAKEARAALEDAAAESVPLPLPRHLFISLPLYLAATLPRYHSSSLPLYICTSLPRNLATLLPRYHATSLPRYLSTSPPLYHASCLSLDPGL